MSTELAFVVATRSAALVISGVAEIHMGDRGELILKDAEGACAAIFAPGEWLHCTPAEADDQ